MITNSNDLSHEGFNFGLDVVVHNLYIYTISVHTVSFCNQQLNSQLHFYLIDLRKIYLRIFSPNSTFFALT